MALKFWKNKSGHETRRHPPIFQIGFNKAGSSSLHEFFAHSGVWSVHWEKGELAININRRILSGEDPLLDYPRVVAFTDMCHVDESQLLEPFKQFQYLRSWYPEALFILNTRPKDKWLKSRAKHTAPSIFGENSESLIDRNVKYLSLSRDEVLDYWSCDWDVHHANVRAYFRDIGRFLEINIEDSSACQSALPEFLNRYIPGVDWAAWPHANATAF